MHLDLTTWAVLRLAVMGLVIFDAVTLASPAETGDPATPVSSQFQCKFDSGAITSLKCAHDADMEYVLPGRRLGDVVLCYRKAGEDWQDVQTALARGTSEGTSAKTVDAQYSSSANGTQYDAAYRISDGKTSDGKSENLLLSVNFVVQEKAILWTFTLQNRTAQPIEIGDLAVPLPIGSPFRRGQPPQARLLKHGLISGDGSYLFWMRSDNAGPSLMLTPGDGTHLEYWETQGGYRVFIHSAAAGAVAKAKGCNWRQPHTSLTLAPRGTAGDARTYGFKFQWAADYDAVRQILVDEGKIDVHVVPGMTVPSDLFAQFALRTKEKISAVEAEFPNSTQIKFLGAKAGQTHLYQVRSAKLGENRLAIRYGANQRMFLEFFSTEPVETLIKKRAAFITRCQHRDPAKWYNGLISEWNMETRVLLGPDNYDRIRGFRIYEVSCDDPGLCKPAFLAAKNAEFPLQNEVQALDYYIQHFVWGGLQRTTDESFAYGIYGIPDWKKNRESKDPGRNGKLHLWRIYDYPHVVLMYFSMYRTAKLHPQIRTALTAKEYLRRAYGTALALFTVPKEIEGWEAYGTGLYNELVIADLIDELQNSGMIDEAEKLRSHWQRKVRFFVNEKPDLFQSEYPFDSTGFEATHALAKYAIKHADSPGADEKTGIAPERAKAFMEKQMAANIFCRGWPETAYYLLGSDFRGSAGNAYTLSYMSQMGGWAVLDYALYYARDPGPYLRLGYASFLSSWALMNSGTPESNYGYWYPGKENDGGAGGGFEPAPYGNTWLGQPHHRGSWYYACEIDLGYCGALRTAATILADDAIFGRVCLGGEWRAADNGIYVTLKDGLRKRFHAMLEEGKLHLILDNDRFVASQGIYIKEDFSELRFSLETDNPQIHAAKLHVSGLPPGKYAIHDDNGPMAAIDVQAGQECDLDLTMDATGGSKQFAIAKQTGH